MPNVSERVTSFIRKQRGKPFCDDCVAAELRSSHLWPMLERMSSVYTKREIMTCTRCGEQKLATVARVEMLSGTKVATKPKSARKLKLRL
jgi:hypothetical protein